MSTRTPTLASILLCCLAAMPLTAQDGGSRQLAVSAGALSYDASGTGNTFTIAARASQAVRGQWLGVELGLAYAPLDEQFSTSPTHLVALDAQLQFRLPTPRVQPYLGVGPGIVTYLTQPGGRNRFETAVSGGLGVRAQVTPLVGIVVDGRVRGWNFRGATDWAVNTGAELTAGLTYRF